MKIDEQARLGIASTASNATLARAAKDERNLYPSEPRIHCMNNRHCTNWAIEGFFFCSQPCRDAYVASVHPVCWRGSGP
jgi:hypothetical protein